MARRVNYVGAKQCSLMWTDVWRDHCMSDFCISPFMCVSVCVCVCVCVCVVAAGVEGSACV